MSRRADPSKDQLQVPDGVSKGAPSHRSKGENRTSYEIKVLPDAPVVELRFSGVLNMRTRAQGLSAAAAEARREKATGLLVDVREAELGEDEILTDAFIILHFMENLGLPPQVRFAFIHPEPDERRQYFSQVAALRNLQVRYFPTKTSAREWLERP